MSVEGMTVGRQLQIICGAMIIAVVIFGAIAFGTFAPGAPTLPGPAVPMVSLVSLAVAAMALVARMIFPTLIANGMRASLAEADDAGRQTILGKMYQSRTIVGMAVLEGAAFMNLCAYMTERRPWSFGVVAFLLAVMAVAFPSQAKFESWAHDFQRDL